MDREIYLGNDAGVENNPNGNLMGMDTPLFTSRSSDFDTSSIPFVFADGLLSFYSQNTSDSASIDSVPSVRSPSSSVGSASFLGVFPDSPRSGKLLTNPVLQRLAIWRHNGDKDHLYVETNCITSSIRQSLSLEDLDPSLIRYGAVHSSLTQISAISCPVMHAFIPLTPFSPSIAEDAHPLIESVITISVPSRSPVCIMCALYNHGKLAFSIEMALTEAPSHFGDAHWQYSAALPRQLVDELCKDADGPDSRKDGLLDSIAVLQFMQHTRPAENRDEDVIFILVCDFEASQGPGPKQTRFSNLSSGTIMSQNPSMRMESVSTPPPPRDNLSDVKDSALESIPKSKQQHSSRARVLPKLSVSIPPPCHTKGEIQLYTESPGLTLTFISNGPFPLTPHTGVPQNVFPVTPFDQLNLTSPHLTEMHHGRACSRAGYALIPTESPYAFTLKAVSPSSPQSPAFGLLDSSRPEESVPSWQHSPRSCTPPRPPPWASSPFFRL